MATDEFQKLLGWSSPFPKTFWLIGIPQLVLVVWMILPVTDKLICVIFLTW